MSITSDTLAEYGFTPTPRDFNKVLETAVPASDAKQGDIAEPTTDLAKAVRAYAERNLPEQVLNHSLRVYAFGCILLDQQFPNWKLGRETLYLTSLLHDIGCTPTNLKATLLSFEFYGGILSLSLLNELKAPLAQAESVAETIIRHQDLGSSGKITQLGMIIQLATVLDNAGLNPHLVTATTIEMVTQMYPRNSWTACFAGTVREEVKLKPWSHTTSIEGFAEMVEGNTLMAPYD